MKKGVKQTTTDLEDDFIGVFKIGNNQYIHVLDKNTITTRYFWCLNNKLSSLESRLDPKTS